MTIKTATGIEHFQNEKGYGKWFDLLFPLVKTQDSCQPDMAVEPSATTYEFLIGLNLKHTCKYVCQKNYCYNC